MCLFLCVFLTHSAHLTNGVHGELGHTDIDGADATRGCEDGPNGRSARHIVAHDELLGRDVMTTRNLLHDESRETRGGIPLVRVRLDHQPFVQGGTMVLLVHFRPVGVQSVGHVSGHKEGARNGGIIGLRIRVQLVQQLVQVVRTGTHDRRTAALCTTRK